MEDGKWTGFPFPSSPFHFPSSIFRVWGGVLLGLVCLLLALRSVELAEVAAVLRRTRVGWMVAALGSVLLTSAAKAARWRALFYPQARDVRYPRLLAIFLIGQMMNLALPIRLGEIARAYLAGEKEGQSKVLILGTLAAEKFLDLVMLVGLFLALIPFVAMPSWLVRPGWATAAVVLAVCIIGGCVWAYPRPWLAGLRWLLAHLPGEAGQWLGRILALAWQGVAALRSPRAMLGLGMWSLLIWALAASTNLAVFAALGMSLSPLAALFLLIVLQVGVAVPSLPGKVGVFHYLSVLALAVFGVPSPLALSCGLLLHLIVVGPPVLVGAACLWMQSWGPRRLQRARSWSEWE